MLCFSWYFVEVEGFAKQTRWQKVSLHFLEPNNINLMFCYCSITVALRLENVFNTTLWFLRQSLNNRKVMVLYNLIFSYYIKTEFQCWTLVSFYLISISCGFLSTLQKEKQWFEQFELDCNVHFKKVPDKIN